MTSFVWLAFARICKQTIRSAYMINELIQYICKINTLSQLSSNGLFWTCYHVGKCCILYRSTNSPSPPPPPTHTFDFNRSIFKEINLKILRLMYFLRMISYFIINIKGMHWRFFIINLFSEGGRGRGWKFMLALGGMNHSAFMTRQFIYLISIYFIVVAL